MLRQYDGCIPEKYTIPNTQSRQVILQSFQRARNSKHLSRVLKICPRGACDLKDSLEIHGSGVEVIFLGRSDARTEFEYLVLRGTAWRLSARLQAAMQSAAKMLTMEYAVICRSRRTSLVARVAQESRTRTTLAVIWTTFDYTSHLPTTQHIIGTESRERHQKDTARYLELNVWERTQIPCP